uniref:FAD-dependent urate hydroxylase-like isoform X2 n=1 Tax=Rhizophora mucronata TaxID=61149 RepID=A0A2P2KDB7_RHIMU
MTNYGPKNYPPTNQKTMDKVQTQQLIKRILDANYLIFLFSLTSMFRVSNKQNGVHARTKKRKNPDRSRA